MTVANLQHSYDAYLFKRLVVGLQGDKSLYLTTADVQAALDERTVLLSYYLGASADGRMIIITVQHMRVRAIMIS